MTNLNRPRLVDSSKLTEQDLDRHFNPPRYRETAISAAESVRRTYSAQPGCTANCDQGRKPCVAPLACQRPEPPPAGRHVPKAERRQRLWRGVALVLGFPVAIVLLVAAVDAIRRALP